MLPFEIDISLFVLIQQVNSIIFHDCRFLKHRMIQQKQKNFLPFPEIYIRAAKQDDERDNNYAGSKRIINILFYYRTFYHPSLIACTIHTLTSVTITKIS